MKNIKKEISWLLKEKYDGELNKFAKKDIERLKRGEPIDYVIGFVEFFGAQINLSQKPFIPRPETEYWVGKVIKELKIKYRKLKILDIFSGSGCIGTAILKSSPELCLRVDFADIDKKFLKQIEINIKLNKINRKKCKIIHSDVFEKIKDKYDFIFANPPYIAKRRIKKVQKAVLNFEPKNSIFGRWDGLFYIKKFLKDAKNYLKKDGKIYLEFDPQQRKELDKILKKFEYKHYQFCKDQYGKWRYIIIK